ncbi:MAG TPA: ATPase domain-containing protein, partial [Nitrososphaera sp.]|nr:ATPase domain-containing protein [Nitrososphaera sp.]
GLMLVSMVAEEKSPDAFVAYLSELIQEHKPKRLVIDSISAFEHSYGSEMYSLTKRIVSLSHEHEITSVFSILTQQASGLNLTTLGISSLFDNIVLLRYVEVEGRMKRSLLLFKMRATAHDESILEFMITNRGITITGAMTDYVGIMTGVAQKMRQEYKDREATIDRREDDERKKRLEDFEREIEIEKKKRFAEFQAKEKDFLVSQDKGRADRKSAFDKRITELGKENESGNAS